MSPGVNKTFQAEMGNTETKYIKCSLKYGTLYMVSVAARTEKGYGPVVTMYAWTEQGKPPKPETPKYVNSTTSTISITIEPVVLTTGPLTNYLIHVEKVNNTARRKRGTDIPGYLTARLSRTDVVRETRFVVGDRRSYGEVYNRALESATTYNIYYAVNSTLNGITKLSYAKTFYPIKTTSDGTDGQTTAQVSILPVDNPKGKSRNNFNWLIVGALLGALTIVGFVIIVVYVCIQRVKLRATGRSKTSPATKTSPKSHAISKVKTSGISPGPRDLGRFKIVSFDSSKSKKPSGTTEAMGSPRSENSRGSRGTNRSQSPPAGSSKTRRSQSPTDGSRGSQRSQSPTSSTSDRSRPSSPPSSPPQRPRKIDRLRGIVIEPNNLDSGAQGSRRSNRSKIVSPRKRRT